MGSAVVLATPAKCRGETFSRLCWRPLFGDLSDSRTLEPVADVDRLKNSRKATRLSFCVVARMDRRFRRHRDQWQPHLLYSIKSLTELQKLTKSSSEEISTKAIEALECVMSPPELQDEPV